MQGIIKWDTWTVIILQLFFALLPIICVAILQNFYVQSAVFASQHASKLFQSSREAAEAEVGNIKAHRLWQQRLVRLYTPA